MKKLVYVMMALVAISFASCDSTTGTKQAPEQDSITTNVDSIKADTVTEDAAQVAAEPTDAPAEAAKTEEKK